MIRTVLLTTAAVALMAGPVLAQTADAAGEAQVRRILERTPLIDGHNDLPWALRQEHGNDPHAVDLTTNLEVSTDLHTDIPRLRAGGMGGQFWSVYVPASMTPPDAAVATFEQIDTVKRLVAAHPDVFELATTADDIQRIHRRGRIASSGSVARDRRFRPDCCLRRPWRSPSRSPRRGSLEEEDDG